MGQGASSSVSNLFVLRCGLSSLGETKRVALEEIQGLPLQVKFQAASCGLRHFAALTSGGQLYIWRSESDADRPLEQEHHNAALSGNADRPQLITTLSEPSRYPTLVSFPSASGVQQIACGVTHTLALLIDGSVYSWGRGEEDLLWCSVPTRLSALDPYRIDCVAAGGFHSACLTRVPEAWVFTWGLAFSEIQSSHTTQQQILPTLIQELLPSSFSQENNATAWLAKDESVTRIACGGVFGCACTNFGRLFSWGGAALGFQQGHLLFEDSNATRIIDFSLGEEHGAALSSSGELYVWGSLLGQDRVSPSLRRSPTQHAKGRRLYLPSLSPRDHIIRVVCGGRWTACLTDLSTLLLAGPQKALSRLGTHANCTAIPLPSEAGIGVFRLDSIPHIGHIAVGEDRLLVTLDEALFTTAVTTYYQSVDLLIALRRSLGVPIRKETKQNEDAQQLPTQNDNPEGSQALVFVISTLLPTLRLHPLLRPRLVALADQMARTTMDVRILQDILNMPHSVDDTAYRDVHSHDVSEAFVRFIQCFQQPHASSRLGPENKDTALISVISRELRTHQEFTVCLLGALLHLNRRLTEAMESTAQAKEQLQLAHRTIHHLNEELTCVRNEAQHQLEMAKQHLKERELRWQNSIQHLRNQLSRRQRHNDVDEAL